MKVKQRIAFCTTSAIVIVLIICLKSKDDKNGVYWKKLLYAQTTLAPDEENVVIPDQINDDFRDLQDLLNGKSKYKVFSEIVIDDKDDEKPNPTMAEKMNANVNNYGSNLEQLQMQISRREMYSEDSDLVDKVLNDLATREIVNMVDKEGGTQLKLVVEFDNGAKALLKPMRYSRDTQTNPNNYYYNDFEKHYAEIAAFHLDRVLGLRRSVPVSGRIINITSEILPFASKKLAGTFFVSADSNICFYGECKYYCDSTHAFCGNPDTIEVSLAAFLPTFSEGQRKVIRSPWRNSYTLKKRALWERDGNYCNNFKKIPPYDNTHRLLQLMELSIFDFLIGNMDRHHYEMFNIFGEDTFPIHLDQGRAFGRPFFDNIPVLAPMLQCCMIRAKTLQTLLNFQNGPKKLSQAMRESMEKDPVAPILWSPHYDALDRRMVHVLQGVRDCLEIANGIEEGSSKSQKIKDNNWK